MSALSREGPPVSQPTRSELVGAREAERGAGSTYREQYAQLGGRRPSRIHVNYRVKGARPCMGRRRDHVTC